MPSSASSVRTRKLTCRRHFPRGWGPRLDAERND